MNELRTDAPEGGDTHTLLPTVRRRVQMLILATEDSLAVVLLVAFTRTWTVVCCSQALRDKFRALSITISSGMCV